MNKKAEYVKALVDNIKDNEAFWLESNKGEDYLKYFKETYIAKTDKWLKSRTPSRKRTVCSSLACRTEEQCICKNFRSNKCLPNFDGNLVNEMYHNRNSGDIVHETMEEALHIFLNDRYTEEAML